MGLSYMSNLCSSSEYAFQQALELPPEVFCFHDDFTLADTSVDSLFFLPQEPSFISQPKPPACHTQHYTESYTKNHTLPTEFQQQNSPKRHKSNHYQSLEETIFSDYNTSSSPPFDGYGSGATVNGTTRVSIPLPVDQQFVLPGVAYPPVYAYGTTTNGHNEYHGSGGQSLSPQTIAARQRRRKISEKTHELGKLIPGGHRMNTAEMFQSAALYVKFLQAQIAALTLTNSLQEGSRSFDEARLKHLAASPVVQEKLYSQEKCLVQRKLVQFLSRDIKLKSEHPSVMKQINSLLMTQTNNI